MSQIGHFFRQARSAAQGVSGWNGPGSSLWRLARKTFSAFNPWLWVFVFIPTLLSGIYLFFIAADLYVSEARFVVRSPSHQNASPLTSLLQSVSGSARSDDDTFAVQDFILSRDAVRKLEANDKLREVFARPEADFVSRFPNFISGKTFEALYKHYRSFVEVTYDSSTGVTRLEAKAYRPEDAQAIASALIRYSEQLVNDMNERAEQSELAAARHEVALAERGLTEIQDQLTAYRIGEELLDPKLASSTLFETLREMTSARILANTQLESLLKDSPNSPQIPGLRTRLAAIDKQLAEQAAKISGKSGSVAAKLGQYEHLAAQQQIAEKSLASAIASLEMARLQVQQQHLYVDEIVHPNLADYPLYPKRLVSFIVACATCLLAYGIAWLLIAGVREHASA